jgi:hypothetical protein
LLGVTEGEEADSLASPASPMKSSRNAR